MRFLNGGKWFKVENKSYKLENAFDLSTIETSMNKISFRTKEKNYIREKVEEYYAFREIPGADFEIEWEVEAVLGICEFLNEREN